MDKTQADAARLLKLPDAKFFALDKATLDELESTLANAASPAPLSRPPNSPGVALQELLAIGAPTAFDWRERDAFPLLVATARTGQREWEVQELQNQWTLVSNLGTGSVELRGSLEPGRRMPVPTPSRSGSPPSAPLAAAGTVGVESFDLLKRFPRESLQGRLAITLIEFDRLSNTIRVDVAGAGAAARRRVQRFMSQTLAQPLATSPAVGVSFTVPDKVGPQAPAVLQAQLRLPREEVTAIAAARPGSDDAWVVAASLLLLKLDDTAPALLHLTVPAQGFANGVNASFGVDLSAALAGRGMSGQYQTYLVIGSTVTGPQPVKVELP